MKRLGRAITATIASIMMLALVVIGVAPAQAAADRSASAARVTVSNVRVATVGAHTATVKFDWRIEGMPIESVSGVCFIVDVNRITEMTPTANHNADFSTRPYDLPCEGGTVSGDGDGSNGIYAVQSNRDLTLPDRDGNLYTAATYTGQQFYRYSTDWNHKSLGGTAIVSLAGLTANTLYGNTDVAGNHVAADPNPLWPLLNRFEALWAQGVRKKTEVDVRTLYAGVRVESNTAGWAPRFIAAKVPGFTTGKDSGSQPDQPGTDDPKPSVTLTPVYRLYNAGLPPAAQHLYTTDLAEYRDLQANHGWHGEGVQFYVPASANAGQQGVLTVHRLYNPYTGAHFYTANEAEYQSLRRTWNDEGAAWHADDDGDADVLRAYNPATGEHLYTVDQHEMELVTANGWLQETDAFKAYSRGN